MPNRIALALIAGLLAGIRPAPAAADLSAEVQFNIAAQQLSAALLKYSEQSGVQIASPGKLIEGKSSSDVVGKFPARDGLERLLKGTNLAYEVIDSNTILIRALDRRSDIAQMADLKLARADKDSQSAKQSDSSNEERSSSLRRVDDPSKSCLLHTSRPRF